MLGFGKGLALSLSAWEEAAIPQEIYSRQVVCGRLSCQHYSRGQAHMIAAASVSLCAPPRPLTRSLDDLRTSASSDGAIRSDGSFAFPIALRSVFGSRGSRRLGARAASIVFQTRARRRPGVYLPARSKLVLPRTGAAMDEHANTFEAPWLAAGVNYQRKFQTGQERRSGRTWLPRGTPRRPSC